MGTRMENRNLRAKSHTLKKLDIARRRFCRAANPPAICRQGTNRKETLSSAHFSKLTGQRANRRFHSLATMKLRALPLVIGPLGSAAELLLPGMAAHMPRPHHHARRPAGPT